MEQKPRSDIIIKCEYIQDNIDFDNPEKHYLTCKRKNKIINENNAICDNCVFSLINRILTIVKNSNL